MQPIDREKQRGEYCASAVRQTFIHACRERSRALCQIVQIATSVAIAVAMLVTSGSVFDAHTRTTQVTWTADVESIVAARCVRCHQAGGFGPMSLASYGDARTWARSIRDEVLSGRMPPWPAAPGYGDFKDEARLSAIEIELLARWADGGAPLGPPVAHGHVDIDLDRAEETLRVELPATTAGGRAASRIIAPVTLDRDRFLSRWSFEPGDRSLVEEAMLLVNGTVIGSWTPFDDQIAYPAHVADRVPNGAEVAVVVRRRRTSTTTIERSVLTLAFGRKPSREVQHAVLPCGSHLFDRGVDLLTVKPIAAAAGDAIEVVARGSDGAVTPVAVVSRYRPDYAVTYRMRAPIRLSRGSRVEIRSSSPGCSATIDYLTR